MNMVNKFYGVKSNLSNDLKELETFIEEININGYTVIENQFDLETMQIASDKLDSIYKIQIDSFGEENLKKIKELNIIRSPLVYDDFFLKLVLDPTIKNIINHFLGDYYIINQQNGIINIPNEEHHQSSWHRDLPYQDYVISKPIAISALICIDDFTFNTGSTNVLPFSHQLPSIPSYEYINKFKLSVNAKKGSVILFNAMLYHCSGNNISDIKRRGLNTLFSIPIIIQQTNISKQLNGKFSEDPFLRRLLGYDIQIPDSDVQWRSNRLKKM